MKPWIESYLKELMPDPCLRLLYKKSIDISGLTETEIEKFYFGDAPRDDLKKKIYKDISILSHLFDSNSGKLRKTGHCVFVMHYDFADPQTIDAGLHLYEHTPDYLRWLLDRMIEEEFHEGIVLVLHRLQEIESLDERRRFDL